MGLPKLFFDNRLADATPVAWGTAPGNYAPANLADFRPYTWWKPSAFSGYYQGCAVKVACPAAAAADFALVYGHDLYTNQCYISIEKSTDNFASNAVVVATLTPSSDDPALVTFNSASSQYWRALFYRINQIDATYESQFDNAYWTRGYTTVNPNTAVAPDGTTTSDTITDADAGNSGYITRGDTSFDVTRTYTASVDVLKDAVPAATRFCTLRLKFEGATTETYAVALDTSTGAILHRNDALAGDVAVVDDTTHWRISVTKKSANQANTLMSWVFYPANGAGALSAAYSAAVTGSCGIWKARIDVADLPSIAIAMIGEAFEMPRRLPMGFDARGRDVVGISNVNDNGHPLGDIIQYEKWKQKTLSFLVEESFVRITWEPVWDSHVRGSPFLFAWDATNYPTDIKLLKCGKGFAAPRKAGVLCDLSFDVSGVV